MRWWRTFVDWLLGSRVRVIDSAHLDSVGLFPDGKMRMAGRATRWHYERGPNVFRRIARRESPRPRTGQDKAGRGHHR